MKKTKTRLMATMSVLLFAGTIASGNVSVIKENKKIVTKTKVISSKSKVISKKSATLASQKKDNLPVLKKTELSPEEQIKALKYERMIKLLSAVDKEAEGGKSSADKEQEIKDAALKAEQAAMVEKFLLPTPIGSIKMQGELIVYAYIKTRVANYPDKSLGASVKSMFESKTATNPQHFALESLTLGFVTKKIKIKKGDVFGDWFVSDITNSFLEYTNKTTQKSIKKFY